MLDSKMRRKVKNVKWQCGDCGGEVEGENGITAEICVEELLQNGTVRKLHNESCDKDAAPDCKMRRVKNVKWQ